MIAKVALNKSSVGEAIYFECPGCHYTHVVWTKKYDNSPIRSVWKWNGSLTLPTIHPSVRVTDKMGLVCHFYLKEGVLMFLNDCTHWKKDCNVPLTEEARTHD